MPADVEILGPATQNTFRMIACPTLNHERRTDRYFPAGRTVGDYLHELGWTPDRLHARVTIDGQLIADAEWQQARPHAGQAVVVRTIPMGGEGKQALQIVAMVALVVAAAYVGGGGLVGILPEALGMGLGYGTAASGLLAGGILIGGSLAINALIAPPRPRLADLSGRGNVSPTFSLTGVSNQATPFARIPRVYGKHRMYPPLAALPYTTVEGNDQYLNMIFCFGYGPLHIDQEKIGETAIENFVGAVKQPHEGRVGIAPVFRHVAMDVVEENLSIELTLANQFQTRTSAVNARELIIDFTFPQGLIHVDGNGVSSTLSVGFVIEYRVVPPDGSNPPWTTFGSTPGVAAKLVTGFHGANNDLVFTYRNLGPSGNGWSILFWGSGGSQVRHISQFSQQEQDSLGIEGRTIIIDYQRGVTLASTVKAQFEANPLTNNLFSVAFAPGNNGTGPINTTVNTVNVTSGGSGAIGSLTVPGKSKTLVRRSYRIAIPDVDVGKQFEVRTKRSTANSINPLVRDQSFWTVLRTVQNTNPVNKAGMALYELKIKATDQLNGVIENFNAVVTSLLLDWTGTEWDERPTTNPASVYRDVLRGSANRRPKTEEQLDLPAIQDFHVRCAAQGFQFNAIIDFQTTVKQLRQDVLAAGRGTFGMRDMKYSVVQDLVQASPVDILTPRTTSGFRWTRRFLEIPHGLKVRFVDSSKDWQQNEFRVYADGFTESNATIYEDVEAGLGVTNQAQAWKLKRRELAEAQLRADDYEVQMDFANLSCTRGDRVQLQHDVILAGLITARIKSVTVNGGSEATDITFDEPLAMDGVTQYAVRIRKAIGAQVVQQIVSVLGEWTTVTFTTPIPAASAPAVGDLVTFGELGRETVDCIVKNIEPGPDYAATLHLLDYAPAIQTADLVAIPPFDSQISLPADVQVPIIYQVVSDETVLVRALDGSLDSRIVLSIYFSASFRLPVTRLETQFRELGSDDNWKVVFSDLGGGTVEVSLAPVEDRETYEIRVRGVDDRTGQVSQWTMPLQHTVVGKSTPPPDVPTMVIEGDRLRWNYPSPPRDLAGFLVRFRPGTSRLWDDATAAHDQIILTTDFQILRQPGVQTFLVKAVDVAGNLSANPATVTVNLGTQTLDNIIISTDHRALGWPGTITNGTIVVGDLQANGTTPFWTADTAPFWNTSDNYLFWSGLFLELFYEFSLSPPVELLDATLKLDLTMVGDWSIHYRTDSSALMWNEDAATTMWNSNASTLMWVAKGEYLAWPTAIDHLTHQQYDFRITGHSGTVQAIIQQLKVVLDVPDLGESFPDVALASGGTRMTLTQTYRAIEVVQVDLQSDGGTAAYVKVIDKSASLGPLVQAFDSSNVATTALVDVVVQGY